MSLSLNSGILSCLRSSQIVFKILLGPNTPSYPEDSTGDHGGVQLHNVSRALPQIAGAAQQVVHLIGFVSGKPKLLEGHLNPSRMHVMRIQVDDDQNDIGQILGVLAIANKLVVLDGMESEAPVMVKRRVLATDPVHNANYLAQALGLGQLPVLDLILLGVEVLFTAGLARTTLAQFKCR